MRTLLFVVFAGGCAPGPITDLLTDAADLPERVRLTRVGDARLTPGGPPLPWDGIDRTVTTDLVVLDPVDLRVVASNASVTLALYVDEADADDVIVEPLAGAAGPWVRDTTGVTLDPGTSVTVVESFDGFDRIVHETERVVVDAWFPAAAIGAVWVPEASEATEGDRMVYLAGGVHVLDAPDGDALATTRELAPGDNEVRWIRADVQADAGEDLLVRIRDGAAEVTGWIPRSATEGWSLGGRGGWGTSSSCFGFGRLTRGEPTIVADTPLYDRPEGEIVGRTLSDLWLPVDDDDLGWVRADVDTLWGTATVSIDPADLP